MNKNKFLEIKLNKCIKENQQCKQKKQNNVELLKLNENIKQKNTKKI